jgi:hypothetical protein
MSDVRNRANSLNVTFPTPGVNNSSQGFRDNTNATQQALFQASDELTKIQNTRLSFVGDAAGQSDRFDNAVVVGAADPTLEINFTLANTILGPVTYNSDIGDFRLSFDAKGRLIAHEAIQHAIDWYVDHQSGITVPIQGTNIGTGSGNLVFPTFAFDQNGRLIATGTKTIPYGLLSHTLNQGSIIVGDSNNQSIAFSPPGGAGAFALVAQGSNLSWQPVGAGSVSGVTGGIGITVTGTGEAPTVNLDIGKLDAEPIVTNTDQFIFLSAGDNQPKRLTVAQLRNNLIEIVVDETPQLGGDLDVQGFSITTSGNNGVFIESHEIAPSSSIRVSQTGITLDGGTGTSLALQAPAVALQSPSLTLNGLLFPSAAGTTGQFLTQGPSNTLVWSSVQQFFQTIQNTIFVGKNGNDTTGNGSLNSPYLTINRALSEIPNGDLMTTYTIMLLGGTYQENVDIQNKRNLAIEGFFGSTNSVIKGNVQVLFNVDSLLMSKITIDTSDQPSSIFQPTFAIIGGVGKATFKDCAFLRGQGPLSDLTVMSLNGQLGGDVNFFNCTIQGKIDNSTIAGGNRVVFQNCGLPENGWTGLQLSPESFTLISGAPLLKGIEHNGGVLIMENVGSIIPENYSVNINNPSLPLWESGRPKFLTTTGGDAFEDDPGVTLVNNQDDEGNNVETLLLDPQGNPIDDPNNAGESLKTPWVQVTVQQPDTIRDYTVGLYSIADANTGGAENRLELTNVNFYYNGEFSKIYKEGNCEWSFTRVKRRSDQDFISGPRLAYDVQPDEGNFVGHYNASGILLRYTEDNSVVPDGVIDPKSGNTFLVNLTGSATLTIKTPEPTSYAPGPLNTSGELYSELLIAVKQDSVGNRQVNFQVTQGGPITWISSTAPNIVPNGLTFYLFRYFSRTRTWVGQKQVDAAGMKVTPVTTASYTLQTSDAGSYIRRSFTGPNQVVVPNNSTVQLNIGVQIHITQIGSGQTEIVPGPSVIINTPTSRFTRTRFSNVTLTKVAANIWDLSGDLDDNQSSVVTNTADNNQINVSSNLALTDGSIS